MAKTPSPKRISAGHYQMGAWTITSVEGEDRQPGYHWCAESAELGAGERFFATKAEAVTFVRNCLRPVSVSDLSKMLGPCGR